MDHHISTHKYQIPQPALQFQPSSPELLISNMQEESLPMIDVDQSLSTSLSSLNLSSNTHSAHRTFLQPTLDNPYGVIGSPVCRDVSSNPFHNNRPVYSGFSHATPLSVDLHQYCYLFSPGASSPGFDPRIHLDYKSYLLVKELVSSTPHQKAYFSRRSSNLPTASSEESLLHNKKVFIPSNNNLDNDPFLSLGTLQVLKKLICFLAKDQCGFKILKSKFETPTEEEIEIVLSEVVGSIADLMKHQFGNHLIQKLICVCDDDKKALIVRELTETSLEIIDVCMNQYGSRAILKLLENLKSPDQIMRVIRALHGRASLLAKDPNGHRVLQYCLLHFDSDFNQLILNQIADNCFEVATNRSGCCVLQVCVEHSRGEVRNRLVAEIIANAIQIAEDPFGNYVLQHMVGLKLPHLTEVLVRQLEGNFAYLSQNKYASNVVEKCLIESRPALSTKIILELVRSPYPSSLLVDPYGNFVIQSALKVSKGFAYECLLKLISRNVTAMQSNLYGKKILDRIEKRRIVLV